MDTGAYGMIRSSADGSITSTPQSATFEGGCKLLNPDPGGMYPPDDPIPTRYDDEEMPFADISDDEERILRLLDLYEDVW